jgi:hypothetical protein
LHNIPFFSLFILTYCSAQEKRNFVFLASGGAGKIGIGSILPTVTPFGRKIKKPLRSEQRG